MPDACNRRRFINGEKSMKTWRVQRGSDCLTMGKDLREIFVKNRLADFRILLFGLCRSIDPVCTRRNKRNRGRSLWYGAVLNRRCAALNTVTRAIHVAHNAVGAQQSGELPFVGVLRNHN